MILLLVEDESYTREGIIKSMNWTQLGIKQVYTAGDGVEGIDFAHKYLPNIVLADIRMPRMNGVDMAKEIRQILPNCALIFMSGYSDQEYFKSAIHLSALDYVNKPLDLDELHIVLTKAIHHVRKTNEKVAFEASMRQQELAVHLIQEEVNQDDIMRLWKQSALPQGENFCMYTLLLKDSNTRLETMLINEAAEQLGIWVLVGRIDAFSLIHIVIPHQHEALLEKFTDRLHSLTYA